MVGAWGPIIGPTWSCGPDPAPTVIDSLLQNHMARDREAATEEASGGGSRPWKSLWLPHQLHHLLIQRDVRGNEIRLYSCPSGGTLAVAFCCREIWRWPFTLRWSPSVSPPQSPALFCPHLLFLSSATLQVTAPCGSLSHPPPPGSNKLLPLTSSDAGEDAIHVNGGIQGAQSPQPP